MDKVYVIYFQGHPWLRYSPYRLEATAKGVVTQYVNSMNWDGRKRVNPEDFTIVPYVPEPRTAQFLREVVEMMGRQGNWDVDSYSCGLFNGLEYALAMLEDREPVFKTLRVEEDNGEV